MAPDRLLGRLNASRRFIVWGAIPLGSFVGGVLASSIGLHATLWVSAIGSSSCFIPVLLSPLRSLREMPAEREPDPTTPMPIPEPAHGPAAA